MFEKIKEKDVIKALEKKAMIEGVEKYEFIMERLYKVDVSKDEKFKKVFIDFYRLDVDLSKIFLEKYFEKLESHKSEPLDFLNCLRYLYKYSRKIHASFASKLLATINPELPIIDRFIKIHFELKPVYGVANINSIINQYYDVIGIYEEFLKTELSEKWIKLFDDKFPNNKISPIKKIDFILWQIR